MSGLVEAAFLGVSLGALYALMATSVTLVYQTTRIPNVAFVAVGTVAAVLHWDLATSEGLIGAGLGWWPALAGALIAAAGLGILTDRLVRAWRGRPVAALLVLVGWTAALLAGAHVLWGSEPKLLPGVWPGPPLSMGGADIPRQQVGALLIAAGGLGALAALSRRTRFGLALRASAADRDAAALVGMSPGRVARGAWAVSSMMAALAVIMVAHPVLSSTYEQTVYLPFAFGAALLGGLRSFRLAAVGGLVLGVVPTLLDPSGVTRLGAVRTLVAFLLVSILVWRRPALAGPDPGAGEGDWSPASGGRPYTLPRWSGQVGLALLVAALVVAVPALAGDVALFAWVRGIAVFLVCASIVVVTGWTGQVSLGQVAFAGFSAYMAANLATRVGLLHVLALPLAALFAPALALAAGWVGLRARGRLPFMVISLGIGVVASSFLWGPRSDWFTGQGEIARPDWMESLSGGPATSLYLVAVAVAGGVVWFAANVRRSRAGRAFAATRDDEQGAASLGIDPFRYRVAAFAFSAFVAGLGGALHAYLVGTIDPAHFAAFLSLQYLLYVLVGGARSLLGVALVVVGFEVVPALGGGGPPPEAVAALGVLAMVAVPIGGLAGVARRLAGMVLPGTGASPPNPVGADATA